MMLLLSNLDLSLPLKNPVVIFSLVLFIILFAPIFFNRIKIPHIIGLILAGVIVGPYGLNLLSRDSSIVLFGTVGLLYIMFLAGLEIDLREFKKNKNKILFFGFTTFSFPFVIGTLASYYILDYNLMASMLLASMFSTHTLVSYPIVSKYGVSRNRAVTLTIGGTMITDILALLILATISGMTKEEVSSSFWITMGLSCAAFVAVVFFIFPIIIRWFFKRFEDSISQYIFVLAIVFLSSFMAEAAGIEAIIGAFFSGLVLNSFIPHSSALMNRIDFVGNALFIPFFLIGVGMLVDVSVLVKGWGAFKVAAVIVAVALLTKYVAAYLTQKTFKLSSHEGKMIFGLSSSHAAATLAIILVGYNIVIGETIAGEPIRLLDEDVLNGTILLILVSCAVSSVVVEKTAKTIAFLEETDTSKPEEEEDQKILISLAYPETVTELVDLGLMLKPKKSSIPVFALHIVDDESDSGPSLATGRKMMDKALKHAAATENTITPLTRFDANISNGIIYTIKEQNISDVLVGLHQNANQKDFLGPVIEKILEKTSETIFIYKSVQPFNTLKRILVAVPEKAELESGFSHWLNKLITIAREASLAITFYCSESTIDKLKENVPQTSVKIGYQAFENWEDFLIFSRELKANDLFLIVSSRKGHISYNQHMEKLPYYLSAYLNKNSFIFLYPKQLPQTLQSPDSFIETITDKINVVNKAGSLLKRFLRKL